MAAEPVVKSGGVGQGTRPSGVATGEVPTADMRADQTLDSPLRHQSGDGSSPGTAVTVSLPGSAADPDRTATFDHRGRAAYNTAADAGPASRTIGPYVVLQELGRGGMGVVYLARHQQLGRTAALKMILGGAQAGTDARQRFLIEAQSIARLSHPGIVTVYDIGEHEGLPYFSLEYIPGDNLSKLVAEKPLDPKEAAALVAKMADAMQYAHDKGLLHRDLKPSNVLMTDRQTPKITDFGLAKQLEGAAEADLTQSGSIVGTPSYMSPEQARGDLQALGPPTDQYSLGAMLYHLLTGRAPFVAPRTFDVIRQVLHDDPVTPRRLAPQVPADLETICLKALHKDAARRYASCRELGEDLTRFLEGRPILARPASSAERLVRWCRRNPVLAATGGTAIAAVLAVFAVISWSSYSLNQKNTTILATNGKLEEANRTVKDTNEALQKSNQQLEQKNLLLDQQLQEIAEANRLAYDRAKQAIDSYKLTIDKARNSLAGVPMLREFRKDLILTALDGLARLPDDPRDIEANNGFQQAKAEEYLYQTYLHLGEPSKAVPHIERALAILKERNRQQEGTDATRFGLAACLLAKAEARQSFERDMQLSLQCSGEAVSLLDSIVSAPKPLPFDADKGSIEPQKVRQLLLRCRNVHTAALWQQGRIPEALQHARRNVELLDETFAVLPQLKALPDDQKRNVRSGMAWIHQLRAVTALRAGEMQEAEQQQVEALDLARLSVKLSGGAWDARRALADVLGFTGELRVAQKDDAQAREAYEESVKLAREVYAQDPTAEQGRNTLNIELIRLAGFEKLRGAEQHQKLYAEAVEVARQMVKTDVHGRTQQVALALSLAPAGADTEAGPLADQILAAQQNPDAELLIDMARVYAQCSASAGLAEVEAAAYRTKALECLTRAKDQGYRDPAYLVSHPDFAALKSYQPFLDLVATISPPPSN